MHQDLTIERWEEERVNTHIRVANCQFENVWLSHYHQVAPVVSLAVLVSVLVSAVCVSRAEVKPVFCTPSVSAESSWRHVDKERIRPCGCEKLKPGVFPSQPPPFNAQETLLRASHLLGLRPDGS